MPKTQLEILQRALERQKKARLQAEKILEEKSKELYDTAEHLKRANARLNNLLDEQADDFDSAFLNIIDPYVVMDLNFDVIRTNESAREFLGFDFDRESLNLGSLVHPDYLQYTRESMQALLELGVLKNYRAKIFTKSRELKFVQINASLIHNVEGKPIAAQGIIRDMTQEFEVEKLLTEQRKQLDIIVENSPLGIVLAKGDRIIRSNATMLNMLGYSQDELRDLTISQISSYLDQGSSSKLVRKLNRGELDHLSIQKSYKRKDGSEFMAKTSVSSVRNQDGEVDYLVALVEDITEHKKLELQKESLLKELQVSNKELEEYAHVVSHDLKSPLRSISALASWLQEDYASVLDDNGMNQLQMMQEKIEGMDNLISGILKYSSIGRRSDDETEVDLNQVVEEIREIIFIPEHVSVVIMNTLPTICVEKTKMHQLFQNLLSNAVTHIENEEGLVKIQSEESPTHWKFSISDNGVGIPPEYHEKIFKIFQSLGNKEGSTGIGLSIVKKIIDLHEGKIWLESEVGKGTTFHFTLKKERK